MTREEAARRVEPFARAACDHRFGGQFLGRDLAAPGQSMTVGHQHDQRLFVKRHRRLRPALSRPERDERRLDAAAGERRAQSARSEEHTSELQSLMRISYAVFCLKKKQKTPAQINTKPLTQHQT